MNPPVTSTPKPLTRSWSLFEELHGKGNTIIMVTHEEDIAKYAHRIVRLRDGLIESDVVNTEITVPAHAAALAGVAK